MEMADIRHRCVELRKRLGMTQKAVADEIGCSLENVSAFENGRNCSSRVLVWFINKGLFDKEG